MVEILILDYKIGRKYDLKEKINQNFGSHRPKWVKINKKKGQNLSYQGQNESKFSFFNTKMSWNFGFKVNIHLNWSKFWFFDVKLVENMI